MICNKMLVTKQLLFLKVMLVKKDEASKKSVINILKVLYFFEYIFLYLIEIVIIVNHLTLAYLN